MIRLCSTRTQILFKSETAQLAISKYFCLKDSQKMGTVVEIWLEYLIPFLQWDSRIVLWFYSVQIYSSKIHQHIHSHLHLNARSNLKSWSRYLPRSPPSPPFLLDRDQAAQTAGASPWNPVANYFQQWGRQVPDVSLPNPLVLAERHLLTEKVFISEIE